ncbi:MAG: hypothetical protein NTZ53_04745 [Cyanobacteria bacterium]|nr:hypothetical protein [Cyanobacteriota bacterium]
MDSDPPPRSTLPAEWAGSVPALRPETGFAKPLASQSLTRPLSSEDQATELADPADLENLLAAIGEEQSAETRGPDPEGSGLGLTAPLIGALIGLLTLVVPLFAVLTDRPAHPLPEPLSHKPRGGGPGGTAFPQGTALPRSSALPGGTALAAPRALLVP